MAKLKFKKVVLAYSGGLDTSIIIPWLKENYDNCIVIAVCVDIGQAEDFAFIKVKALKSGASKCYIVNAKQEFIDNYVSPLIKSGAKYEQQYIQGTISRPLIAQKLIEIAHKEKIDCIVHGATGKGNDQVRFEHTIQTLDPYIKIIAPWRHWAIKSRQQAMVYAKKHHIPIIATKKSPYSIDANLWYVSHEGGILEGTKAPTPYECLNQVIPVEKADSQGEIIELDFVKGLPTKLNGKTLKMVTLLQKLNQIGAKHGIGINDIIESRLVGMKVRGVYETPAATIVFQAHKTLEHLCLDRDMLTLKQQLEIHYANLVYNGKWFTQSRIALDHFFTETNSNLTGQVTFKLYKGNIIFHGIKSPYSLFNKQFATFEEEDVYNQADAIGFINIYSLSAKIYGMVHNKKKDFK